MGTILIAGISVYQRFLSPLLGNNCRFQPSCSQYAVEAIRKYGAMRGSAYAIWRIARCQPFCTGGHDPVP